MNKISFQVFSLFICLLLAASTAVNAQASPQENANKATRSQSAPAEDSQKKARPTSRPRKAPEKGRVNHWGGNGHSKRKHGDGAAVRMSPEVETILEAPIHRRMAFWLELYTGAGQLDSKIVTHMQLDLKIRPSLCEEILAKVNPQEELGSPTLIALLSEHASHDFLPPIHDIYTKACPLVQHACSMLFRKWEPAESYDIALEMLKSKSASVQSNALALLGQLGNNDCVETVIEVAKNSSLRKVKHEAARTLGVLQAKEALPVLVKFYEQKKDRYLKRAAGIAICQLSGAAAEQFMRETWQNQKDPRLRLAAISGMHRLGLQSSTQLLEIAKLDSVHPWLREQTLRIWAQATGSSATKQLLSWVESPASPMAAPALIALQDVNLSEHSGRVLKLLTSSTAPKNSKFLYEALLKSLQNAYQS